MVDGWNEISKFMENINKLVIYDIPIFDQTIILQMNKSWMHHTDRFGLSEYAEGRREFLIMAWVYATINNGVNYEVFILLIS